MTCFSYLPVLSPLHQPSALGSLVGELQTALKGLGGRPLSEGHHASHEATPLWLVATGGTEQQIMQQRGRRQALHGSEPALLIAHAAHNSLPAALETLARIQQDGGQGRILYLDGPTDTAGFDEIARAAVLAPLAVDQAANLWCSRAQPILFGRRYGPGDLTSRQVPRGGAPRITQFPSCSQLVGRHGPTANGASTRCVR